MSDDTSNNAPSPKTEFELAQETYCAAELVEKTEIICKVCGDAASGRHYGVVSCEGCKGFFKRTIQLKLTYKCKQLQNSQKNSDATFVDKDGVTRCVIDKDSRNDCQKCRFDICVAVGMNEQLIRKDFPGATKKRRIQDAESESSSDASTDVSSPSSTISNHDSLYNEYALVDDDKNLLKTLTSIQADKVPWCNQKHQLPPDSPMPESLKPELSELFQSAFEELRDVVRWARQVPGFTDISTEDQMTLLKNCFLDIIVFRLSWRSTPYQDKALFNKGFCLNLEEAISLGLDPELFHLTLHYVKLLRNIGLDLTEFCTMQAIMLTFARCNNISTASQNTATQMQNRFMQCLCRYVKSTHPTQPLRYCRIIQLLSSIKGLSIKAMDRFLTQALTGEIMVDDYVYNFVT